MSAFRSFRVAMLMAMAAALVSPIRGDMSGSAGRLCVASADSAVCHETTGNPATIPPSNDRRTFVWILPGQREIGLGVIEPHEQSVGFPQRSGQTWPLTVSQTSGSNLVPASIHLQHGALRWLIPIEVRDLGRIVTLRIPGGVYDLEISADHYESVRAHVTIAEKAQTKSRRWTLVPLPRISGNIVDARNQTPIAGAVVTLANEKTFAVSEAAGRFDGEIRSNDWPDSLRIAAAGFGSDVVAVPRTHASASLGIIRLSRGVSVHALITIHNRAPDENVSVALIRLHGHPGLPLVKKAVADSGEVELRDVAPGDYRLLVEGKGALERYVTELTVRSTGQGIVRAEISAVRLDVHTWIGERRLPNATLDIHAFNEGLTDEIWRSTFASGAEGKVTATLWQSVDVVATVVAPEVATPFVKQWNLSAEHDSTWNVRVPDRTVVGIVRDATSSAPIANARIALRAEGPDGSLNVLGKSGEDGRFRFSGVVPGMILISAAADGYAPKEIAARFELMETATSRDVVINLDSAAERRIFVSGSVGPAIGATVVELVGSSVVGVRTTDAYGELSIPVITGQRKQLLVVTREGSFTVAALTTNHDRQDIVVPDPTASLDMRTEGRSGDAIPDVLLLMRYNGQILPIEALNVLSRQLGFVLRSDSSGWVHLPNVPTGLYEFWPFGSYSEMLSILNSLTPPPVRIGVEVGRNEARLRFNPVESPGGH